MEFDVLYNSILENYNELKNKFDKGDFKESKWFLFKYGTKELLVGLDMGFNLTIVHEKKDIKKARYLLEQENPNFSTFFNYLFLGEIRLLNEDNYELRALRKNEDSFYEQIDKKEAKLILNAIDFLYSILDNELATIMDINYNCYFIGMFDLSDFSYTFSICEFNYGREFDYYPRNIIKDKIFKSSGEGYIYIEVSHIELPIYSSKYNKLINPYVLRIKTNDDNMFPSIYLLEEDENTYVNKVLEILSHYNIPNNVYITDPYLYRSIRHSFDANVVLEDLCFDSYDANLHVQGNLFDYFDNDLTKNKYIDFDDLSEVVGKLEEIKNATNKLFDDSDFDEYLFETAYPKLYKYLVKFYKNSIVGFDMFATYFFHYQVLSGLYNDFVDEVQDESDEKLLSYAS